ncbi:uncharacterized protein LOC115080593 [Rhinatrema bivittatum]|uniref:uncharacterized protein LOC115080593 n=1 Tax=Rhinatrema bivittatum TaxID=194408 RepID=UPI00112D03F4|nr:uncharacterized protein LOC115080593 [Rhinatrema bivittatum]
MGRKRKAKVYTSSPVPPHRSGPMDQHVIRQLETPEEDSLGATSLVSLSPGERLLPPPQPNLEPSREAACNQLGAVQGDSRELQSLDSPGTVEIRTSLTLDSARVKIPVDTQCHIEPVVIPENVTLVDLGRMISRLDNNIMLMNNSLSTVINGNRVLIDEQARKVNQCEKELGILTNKVQLVQQSGEVFIRDSIVMHKEIEYIENMLRVKNLRITNFPVTRLLSPEEMFKKFLKEILFYDESDIPKISRIFYFPQKRIKRDQDNMVSEAPSSVGVSTFLEESIDIITNRATLFISFLTEQDKENVFKKFFRYKDVLFCGQKIQIFPDVARATQAKRKYFLSLKNKVLALNATFFLKFPCLCFVTYQGKKFVFSDPAHLEMFLVDKNQVVVSENEVQKK